MFFDDNFSISCSALQETIGTERFKDKLKQEIARSATVRIRKYWWVGLAILFSGAGLIADFVSVVRAVQVINLHANPGSKVALIRPSTVSGGSDRAVVDLADAYGIRIATGRAEEPTGTVVLRWSGAPNPACNDRSDGNDTGVSVLNLDMARLDVGAAGEALRSWIQRKDLVSLRVVAEPQGGVYADTWKVLQAVWRE